MALETRPDLKAAVQSVDKAKTDHTLAIANGSTDPTFGMDLARNPPIPVYVGFSVTIPLRIFDKNQGEKLRTQLDIGRNEKLRDATEAQVFSDVDSAYATLNSNLTLLRPYKADYLRRALKVRDAVAFAYQRGGASLLDFLNAENAEPIGQSEEHLVVKVPDSSIYKVGDVFYGVPVHICPTVALYDKAIVVENNKAVDEWMVIARDRKITV